MKKSLSSLKVAIYYDWLDRYGGAEKVLLDLLAIFPQADLFTLFADPFKTPWLPKKHRVHTSFLQHLPRIPLLTPLYDVAAESLDFSAYDLIIGTTTNVGHCLITPATSLFVCYYHNLNRHLYLQPPLLLSPLLSVYQKLDRLYARRPDAAFCNSQNVRKRLKKYLSTDAQVIYPGIDTEFFKPVDTPTADYFLIVGRLVAHKKIDYVLSAFRKLPFKLKIVGNGRDLKQLKSLAPNNVEFLPDVDNHQLLSLYQNCRALICPQLEDFGLVSLEAQSCGRPVIGFRDGGNLETIVDGKTGLLYPHQTPSSLTTAITKFPKFHFSPETCRLQAQIFDHHRFMLNLKQALKLLWQKQKQHHIS